MIVLRETDTVEDFFYQRKLLFGGKEITSTVIRSTGTMQSTCNVRTKSSNAKKQKKWNNVE